MAKSSTNQWFHESELIGHSSQLNSPVLQDFRPTESFWLNAWRCYLVFYSPDGSSGTFNGAIAQAIHIQYFVHASFADTETT